MSGHGYHHGDLPNVVKRAALEVLAAGGPSALSLRQVATTAGVSHTAPRHHFGDKQHLLTELAADGFDELASTLDAIVDATDGASDDPVETVAALLATYVDHARTHPGHASVMWRTDLVDTGDPRLARARLSAFSALHAAVRRPGAPLADRIGTYRLTLMLWCLAQGASDLADLLTPALGDAVADPDPGLPGPEVLVADFARAVLRPRG